ncbi:DUF488 domain-containing protein [Henriciella aquimarina]|uniref:DUF488 domain-containing protein n=1 Tax=Henriciella aquimarina TaxID=545261 RepID=UPI001F213B19|nr:DUF488 family protein [Henriciella aquimarina]
MKRIYDTPSNEDGARFLVDRLWPRGLSKDKAGLTAWLKTVSPSNALRKRLHGDAIGWDEFVSAYVAELQGEAAQEELETIRKAASKGRVTLLFASKQTERNNATVLRDYLMKQD